MRAVRRPSGTTPSQLKPGQYCRWPAGDQFWTFCAPNGRAFTIDASYEGHTVSESREGLVTLRTPVLSLSFIHLGVDWYGTLEAGVWKEA